MSTEDTMREDIILFSVSIFLCVAGTIVISTCFRYIRRLGKKCKTVSEEREHWLNQVANDEEMIILVYSGETQTVDFLSETAGWRYGLDKENIFEDVTFLFKALNLPMKDELICQFLQGDYPLLHGREYEVKNVYEPGVTWYNVRLYACGRGKNILMISDRTKEHAQKQELLAMRKEFKRKKLEDMVWSHLITKIEKMPADPVEQFAMASLKVIEMVNDAVEDMQSEDEPLSQDDVLMDSLMRKIAESVMSRITDRRQRLELDLSGVEDEIVTVDETRLTQVILKLLENASMYTPEDGTVKLSVSQRKAGSKEFVIAVEDNGIGISPEFMPKLFQPFERADDPRVRSLHGRGLGLVIAKNILDRMGGRIEVESEIGIGSCFRVYLELEHEK